MTARAALFLGSLCDNAGCTVLLEGGPLLSGGVTLWEQKVIVR